MSKEFFYSLDAEFEFNERMKHIDYTFGEINERLAIIADLQPHITELDSFEAQREWLVLTTREHQLRVIAELVLGAAEENDNTFYIDIENPELLEAIEMPSQNFFDGYPDEAFAASKEGELLGTNDFLEIITPDDIVGPNDREVYFLPWTRSMFEKIHDTHPFGDGSIWHPCPTRVPNVEVLYYYPPGENVPERMIQLKNRYARELD